MEVMRELMKRPRTVDTLAIVIFAIAVLYTVVTGTAQTALLGVGFTLVVLGALPRQVALAFLVGASAILLVQTKKPIMGVEGFADVSGMDVSGQVKGAKEENQENQVKETENQENQENQVKAQDAILKGIERSSTEGFSKNASQKPMLPDNADRKEPLELGKPYKLPNEHDDKGFHLDSGTTFLNAYKALKPDQIAAMTKDTQDLLATQKSLIGMLDSFGPLMKDMSKITGFFGTSN
jgi:hypothetical protein